MLALRASYVTRHVTLPSIRADAFNGFRTVSRARRARRDRARRGAGNDCGAARAARRAAGAAPAVAQIFASRLAVREEESRRADQRTLHPRRRRTRQDHADGLVLRRKRREAETPRAFSRVHGRRARARARLSSEDQIRRDHRRRSDRPHRDRARRRGLASLLRRIPRHRHRRCDDSRAGCSHGCSRQASWSWPRRMSSRTSSTRTA